MRKYEVWMEGHGAQGNAAGAHLVGKYMASDFAEACRLAFTEDDGSLDELFNPDTLTYWGCGLFDNEMDARRNYG